MKRLIKKSIIVVLLLTAFVSQANETNNAELTNVSLTDVTEGSVLSIKDINGLILYKETIKIKGNYSKNFDLTSLPNGNYIFELNKDFEIKIIPFVVVGNAVTFDKENESIVFKPSINTINGVLNIHKTILNAESLVLNIYYENGDLVYTEKIENVQIFRKSYDFSKSLDGKYKIVMSNGDRTFEKEIEI